MLLEVKSISKTFMRTKKAALKRVCLTLSAGQILGIVGESGSGKTTLLKIILRLLKEDSGQIVFEGKTLASTNRAALKLFRKKTQVVFQDPLLSLDPRMKIRAALEEPFLISGHKRTFHLESRLHELMKIVGLPLDYLEKVPAQLSGGECQRVAIARAISRDPELLVCDEPVSSLDALTRAQILNLLLTIHKTRRMSMLFVSHDLRVIRHLCDRVLVMKDGCVVEEAHVDDFFRSPKHPYSLQLITAARHKS